MAWLRVGLYVAAIFVTLPLTPLLWSALPSYFQTSFRLATSFVLLLPFVGCAFVILRRNRQSYQTETEKGRVALRRGDTARGRHGDCLQVPASPCPRVSVSLFWRMAGLVLLVVLSLLTVIPLAETPVETFHLLEYGALSYLTLQAAETHTRPPRSYLLCFVFVLLVGSVDEAVQSFVPSRFFHVKDILLNGLCGAIGLATTTLLHPPEALPWLLKADFYGKAQGQ